MDRKVFELLLIGCVLVVAIILVVLFVKKKPDFNAVNLNGKKVVLFYAKWCVHSKNFLPTWERLVQKYNGKYEMVKIDVDENSTLADSFGVTKMPSIFIQTDNNTTLYHGSNSYNDLVNFIDKN